MWDNMRLWGKYEAVESMRLWEMYRVNGSLLDIEFSELLSTSFYFLGPFRTFQDIPTLLCIYSTLGGGQIEANAEVFDACSVLFRI